MRRTGKPRRRDWMSATLPGLGQKASGRHLPSTIAWNPGRSPCAGAINHLLLRVDCVEREQADAELVLNLRTAAVDGGDWYLEAAREEPLASTTMVNIASE